MAKTSQKQGVSVIQAFVKTLPGSPGVYRMLDRKGTVLYVGKAKHLKKRVTNYTQPEKQSVRIQRMIHQTATMEFTTTHTEAEALLLEASLIKRLKPLYNILLRDDKSFPYILITGDHDFPQVTKHRGGKNRKGEYFGPFASTVAVNHTLALLQRIFMLRNCPDTVFASRSRPCLQYQIKRCTAPCVDYVSKADYAKQVKMARDFLTGKSRKLQERFAKEMQQASDAQAYELAASYRDKIRALTSIQAQQTVHMDSVGNTDIHALHRQNGQSCVQVFFYRAGQNYGNRAYFPRHEQDAPDVDILTAFIAQFYTNRPVPKDIMVNVDLSTDNGILEKALSLHAGHKVQITRPQRGARKQLMAQAVKNAAEALARKQATDTQQAALFDDLVKVFDLETAPKRVEVYDNSHISGSHALGAMIVATPDGFQKNAYRKFNMKNQNVAGDDYGMMREMLTRRLKQAQKADPDRELGHWPDLMLIDGGKGQLSAALEVMAELGVTDLAVAAIAKGPERNAGRETFFLPDKKPFTLPRDDRIMHFLQRLRDEAHRFAITSHRGKRSKSLTGSPLDDIPGIGAKRKKALLLHFGSAKEVATAGLADLEKVSGISKTVAQTIYNHFHESG